MRAILIDPERRTCTEIELADGGFRGINAVLQCESHTSGAHLSGSIGDGFDMIAVSDDDMEERENPQYWFQLDANQSPPSSFPIAGRGLAIGIDKNGDTCASRISVAALSARITFTRRKFLGFRTQYDQPGVDLAVSPIAPIIDE